MTQTIQKNQTLEFNFFKSHPKKREGLQTILSPELKKPITELSDEEIAPLCYIDPKKQTKQDIKNWLEANWEARRRVGKKDQKIFTEKGWAHNWFVHTWKPEGKSQEKLAEQLEESLHIAQTYYPAIVKRGLDKSEDIGLLQSQGRGGSEGIRAKKAPYGNIILLQIVCSTGPSNFDPSQGTVEFEPGSKSHLLRLAYKTLPTLETLEGDIAAYPLISLYQNRIQGEGNAVYRSEGFTSSELARKGIPCHRPWDTLTQEEIQELIST